MIAHCSVIADLLGELLADAAQEAHEVLRVPGSSSTSQVRTAHCKASTRRWVSVGKGRAHADDNRGVLPVGYIKADHLDGCLLDLKREKRNRGRRKEEDEIGRERVEERAKESQMRDGTI